MTRSHTFSTDAATQLIVWARRLESISEPEIACLRTGVPSDRVAAFCDEQGNQREVDRLALARVLNVELNQESVPAPASGDVALWRALHSRRWPTGVLQASVGGQACPLVQHRPSTSVEVWTESELCALHALWNCARVFDREDLRERALEAAKWHVSSTQPDNATNHAWATHVFAALACRGHAEADLYAQTLIHNCCVGSGRPDRVSAIALRDGATELYAAAEAWAKDSTDGPSGSIHAPGSVYTRTTSTP